MKKTSSWFRLGAACLLAAAVSSVASAFEGKVDMKVTSSRSDENTTMSYYIKGARIRMETTLPADKHGKAGGTAAMIMDVGSREMIMLMSEQKMYMVHKLSDDSVEKAEAKAGQVDFKPTGRKEKIAGIEAEEYVGESNKKLTEIWVTKELGKFITAGKSGGPMGGKKKGASSGWEKFAEQNDLFPLRTIQRKKEGAPEDFRMEVTKIDRSTLPDSLFKPPADYEKFEMPSMGGMMKGMMPGGTN